MDTSVRLCRQIEATDVELGEGFNAAIQKQAQKYGTTLKTGPTVILRTCMLRV